MAINKAKAIEAAQKLIGQNKLKEAVAEYLKIYKEDAKDQNVLNALGDLHVRLNSNAEALTYYGKLADIYVGDGFLVRGIAMYKKISKLDPANTQAMERLADLYTMQGLMTDARAQYMQLAEAHLKASATQKAMEVMAKVLDLDPSNVKIQQRLADLYEHHGQGPQAAQIYRRLAEHALQENHTDEALKWLQKATALAPNDASVLLLQAQLEQRTGKAAAALKTLEKIPNLEEHPEALNLVLKAKLESGDAAGAEKLGEKLFASDPRHFSALLEIARHVAEHGDGEKAWGLLQRVAEPALEHPAALLPAARKTSALLADSAEAADLFAQAARKAGDTAALLEALGRRAQVAERAEDFARAKQVYDELVTLQPENPEFSQKLQAMREKLGEPAVAAAAPTEAPMSFAEMAEAPAEVVLDEETQAYVNASMTDIDLFSSYGMTDKAIELARQVLERVPTHLPAMEKLLDFYLGSGNDQGVVDIAKRLEPLYRQAGNSDRAEEVAEVARRYAGKITKEAVAEAPVPTAAAAPEAVHEVDLSAEWATTTEEPAAAEPAAVEAPAAFNAKEAGEEIEFYLNQGLVDQAQAAVARYEEQFPGESGVAALRARVDAAAAPAPVEEAPAEAAPVEEAPAAVGAQEEGQTYEISLEPQPAQQPATAGAPMSAGDFFSDLAGDLDKALGDVGAPPAPSAPPAAKKKPAAPPPAKAPAAAPAAAPVGALTEVFEEFKEELGEVEEVEDPETHYNLGIAYKEMGLLEESISEFQKVVKAAEKTGNPSHLFQVCTLLGVCFMDKGLPNIAVKWYERALKSPGLDEEGALALRYDMGIAHEQAGNRKAALDCFMEVYGANVDYRNVGERIRELQGTQ